MSLEWPTQNTETVEATSVEKTEEIEREQNFEQELSPEQIEQIMAKVQDIDLKGTAYRCLNIHEKTFTSLNILRSNLTDGLLGSNQKARIYDGKHEITRVQWAEGVKNNNSGCVQFNIVGKVDEITNIKNLAAKNIGKPYSAIDRKFDHVLAGPESLRKIIESPEINLNFYSLNYHQGKPNRTYIIFDITNFKEIASDNKNEFYNRKSVNEKNRSYYQLGPSTQEGFGLSFRVAPRLFKGIVLKASMEEDYFEQNGQAIKQEVEEIIKVFREINFYLPIYNAMGDLVWPKQMDYEEVQKFVAERDEKNSNIDENK